MPEVGAVLADVDDGVVASEVSKTGIEQEVVNSSSFARLSGATGDEGAEVVVDRLVIFVTLIGRTTARYIHHQHGVQ
jgi:hypothetical protein